MLGLSEVAILVLVCQFFVSWENTRVGFGEGHRILFVKVEDSLLKSSLYRFGVSLLETLGFVSEPLEKLICKGWR